MKTILKYRNWLWAALQSLGPWGVFLAAGLDGAGLPLPGAADAVLAAYVHQTPARAWLYVVLASTGSALGCLVIYLIGYWGGEVLIERRMPAWKFQKISHDFDHHPFLTVVLPAMLPPPFPFKLMVLAAGAFEMPWLHFLLAIALGRLARFTALATLTVVFGPQIIGVFQSLVHRHPLAALAAVLAVVAVVWAARRLRRAPAPLASYSGE